MMKGDKIGVGIDLGTANLLIYIEKQGITFNEPSIVSFDRETGNVIAAGFDAREMLGKTHEKISVVKPLADGVISDMKAAKALLTYVFEKIEKLSKKDLKKVKTLICCPSEVTKIEKDIMIDLGQEMGMEDIFIEEEVKSAALGAGIDIYTARGTLMVDIGGGTTDVGVLSFGDTVLSRTIRMAGNYIDNEIYKFVKKTHKVEIGELTSEEIKKDLATLNPNLEVASKRYAGSDIVRKIPTWLHVTNQEICSVITPIYEEVVNLVKAVLKDTPPELSADIFKNGIQLTGGGAMVDGVEEFFKSRLRVPVTVVKNPLTAVVEGTKTLLKNRGDYLDNPAHR